MINVAINGFGRIGRTVFRVAFGDKNINIVAINDLTDTPTLAHLLKYDSVHGIYQKEVSAAKDALVVEGKKIKVFAQKDPALLPWKELKIDVVLECTGFFLTKELASKHLQAGAKKVLISADAKDKDIKTIILGVNQKDYNPKMDNIISNASCTSNCTAPMVKVLNDYFKVEHLFFTTTHAYTSTQKLEDGPDKNLRNARAAAVNIIPHSSGAASAVPKTIPGLKNLLDGMALRVPVIDGSITVVTAVVHRLTNADEINKLYKRISQTTMKNILDYSDKPLVSSDIIGNPHSCIIDSEFTKVNGKLVQVVGWYDNEWGYSCRMVDLLRLMI